PSTPHPPPPPPFPTRRSSDLTIAAEALFTRSGKIGDDPGLRINLPDPAIKRIGNINIPIGSDCNAVRRVELSLGRRASVAPKTLDRKSTRLNSSHVASSYAGF